MSPEICAAYNILYLLFLTMVLISCILNIKRSCWTWLFCRQRMYHVTGSHWCCM